MKSPGDLARIQHMLQAVLSALDAANGKDWAALANIEFGRSHLIRQLEVLGEAANAVSPELRKRYPEIPWRYMISMRNKLIHAYFEVDFELVWLTVQDRLPQLKLQLEQVLRDHGIQ